MRPSLADVMAAPKGTLIPVYRAFPGDTETPISAFLKLRRGGVGDTLEAEVRRARDVCSAPVAVGFGVATQQDAARVARCADGVIVGSALVKEGFLAFQQAVAQSASQSQVPE